jgi:uncharacterized membrane protein
LRLLNLAFAIRTLACVSVLAAILFHSTPQVLIITLLAEIITIIAEVYVMKDEEKLPAKIDPRHDDGARIAAMVMHMLLFIGTIFAYNHPGLFITFDPAQSQVEPEKFPETKKGDESEGNLAK